MLLLSSFIPAVAAQETDAAAAPRMQEGRIAVHLYFADRNTAVLRSERRSISIAAETIGAIRRIVEALIAGPQSKLMRTLPAASGLRAVYWSDDGTATVDFTEALVSNHPGGCATEMLSVYSVVNTLVLNLDDVQRVKILVGGQEPATLAGHVDLRDPLEAEMLLVK